MLKNKRILKESNIDEHIEDAITKLDHNMTQSLDAFFAGDYSILNIVFEDIDNKIIDKYDLSKKIFKTLSDNNINI